MPASQLALWDMRWEHAQGRIAARRGRRTRRCSMPPPSSGCCQTVADENQRAAYPYLLGYIDFYTHHYRPAIESLKQGSQEDVFVLGLIAESYRKLHDEPHAREYFERVLAEHRAQHQCGLLAAGRASVPQTRPAVSRS